MTKLPTGLQFPIAAGRYGAVVTEVGATLRSFTCADQEVLWTFAEDEMPRGSMGRQLVPWPNRIRDGRYTFDGIPQQVPITEVERNTALHGLGDGMPWRLISHTSDEVVLACTIYAQLGWPAVLDVEIGHRVDAEAGLIVTATTRNVGAIRAPFGYGAHPYVAADLGTTKLRHTFSRELLVDPERLLPITVEPISPELDFRTIREVGATVMDTAFTGIEGDWLIEIEMPERTVEVWADETMSWAQIFTNPKRDAIAVEPMTCGPDAFNEGPTHNELLVLEPGEQTRSVWGMRIR